MVRVTTSRVFPVPLVVLVLVLCQAILVVEGAAKGFEDHGEWAAENAAAALSKGKEDRDKVKVELYYMPQCPGCRQLITTSIREAFHTPGFSDMADVTFVPYAAYPESQTLENPPSHERIMDNVLESCALNIIGRRHQERQFDYIDCIDHDQRRDPSKVDRFCALTIGLSAKQTHDIDACAASHEGRALAERNLRQTESIGATYYPWIVVNRAHSREIEASVWTSLFGYVCERYVGPHKSTHCPETDEEDDEVESNDDDDDSIAQQL